MPTTACGVLLFSCSTCVLIGSPPKKFPTLTVGMYVLKRSNSWQICGAVNFSRQLQRQASWVAGADGRATQQGRLRTWYASSRVWQMMRAATSLSFGSSC